MFTYLQAGLRRATLVTMDILLKRTSECRIPRIHGHGEDCKRPDMEIGQPIGLKRRDDLLSLDSCSIPSEIIFPSSTFTTWSTSVLRGLPSTRWLVCCALSLGSTISAQDRKSVDFQVQWRRLVLLRHRTVYYSSLTCLSTETQRDLPQWELKESREQRAEDKSFGKTGYSPLCAIEIQVK